MPPARYVADEDWFDNLGIGNDEVLWRRIKRERIKPHPRIPGQFIASDQEYRTIEMSVYLASQTTQEAVLANCPNDSLVAFTVGFIRQEQGLIVVRDPNDTDPNPAHVLVGRRDHNRIASSTAYAIAEKAAWVVLKLPEQKNG